jgi:flagellar biosynthesis protein FlhF
MKIMTFSGETPSEALKKVQHQLGDDAVVIETKEVKKRTFNSPGLYEVIVGVREEVKKSPQKSAQQRSYDTILQHTKKAPAKKSKDGEDVLLNISEAAKQISEIAKVTESAPMMKKQTKSANEELKELKLIKDEIAKLGDKVKLMQNMFWDDHSVAARDGMAIPPEFAEIYKIAKNSGMKQSHVDSMMHLTLENMPLKMRENSETVKRFFHTILRKMIPIRQETLPIPPQKRVMMLVGPTGVGKTTSIAKLAARFSYMMDKKYKVGLIVLDTYRIGAVEQLMQYARMMKLGIETVIDPPEFATALNALKYCDYILVDTMGSSPYDSEKISTIQQCLNSDLGDMNIETTLVLSSSAKYSDLISTYDRFSPLGINTVMFTKLDETDTFGNLFSLVHEVDKPISYLSIGQEVPEDLIVGNSSYLVDCLLNGFKRGEG